MKKLLFLSILAATIASAQKPRVEFGQRNEPKGTILFGAGQNDLESFNGFANAVGFTPSFYMGYITLGGSFNYMFSALKANTAKLPKGVGLQIGLGFAGAGNSQKAANGSYDSQVKALADWLKTLDRKGFIRIGYEFDFRDNQYTKSDFKIAFVRFADILRANANTATVWCSSGGSGAATAVNIMSWYPGDRVTDWWGWDFFNQWELRPDEIGRAYRVGDSAAAHRKPLMIGECHARGVGVLKGKESWDKWFAPFFAFVANAPSIKAISWINQNGADHANDYPGAALTGDNRLEKNAFVSGAFKHAVKALVAKTGAFDTLKVKVWYQVPMQVTHDTLVTMDSVRSDLVERKE